MILEDDVLFGKHSCKTIEGAVASIPVTGWDLIFTDVCITNIHSMIELLELRRSLVANQQTAVLDIKPLMFAGATAYVINRGSKAKVLDLLDRADPLDVPYDLYLRERIRRSEINARVLFPFATSLSVLAESSSIQQSDGSVADLVWNAFRRLVWSERDIEQAVRPLEGIEHEYFDSETTAVSRILAAQLSPRYRLK